MENEDSKILGIDKDNQEIILKKGPYGYYVEKTADKKPKRISLPANMTPDNITLEQADFLLNLPLKLSKDISISIGKFGPYIKQGKEFFSLKEDMFGVNLEKAQEIIKSTIEKKNGIVLGRHHKTKEEITLKYGRYGAYLVYRKENIKIPKEYKNKDNEISLEQAIEIIYTQKDS